MNDVNPYEVTPKAELHDQAERDEMPLRYAGFWIRFAAAVIDSILQSLVLLPLLWAIYGEQIIYGSDMINGVWDVLLSYVAPFVAYVFFWVKYGGTPGKRLLGLKVLDQATRQHVSVGKGVLRYIGYIASALILMIGFIWAAFDKEKKALHDHMAGTVVVFD